ncbi:MAG: hypothetical protein V4724_34885 [Pseudomonadota bacterium]
MQTIVTMDFWPAWIAIAVALALLLALAWHDNSTLPGAGGRHRARLDAARAIHDLAHANARSSMALLLTNDQAHAALIAETMENNRLLIEAALATLARLTTRPREQALLAGMQAAHAHYCASSCRVGLLIEQGQRLAPSTMLRENTLPALDRLSASLDALSDPPPHRMRARSGWRGLYSVFSFTSQRT